MEGDLVPAAGLPLDRLWLRSLRSVERDVHLVLDPLRLGLSVPQAVGLLARRRPAAIFATGGYVAIPTVLAARLLRIPVLLWEGNVVPGRSVRLIAPLTSAVALSYAETGPALGRGGTPMYLTGTPIRDTRDVDREAARQHLAIPPGARPLLVFGGSQAARRLNGAVLDSLPHLVERVHVLHVAGH